MLPYVVMQHDGEEISVGDRRIPGVFFLLGKVSDLEAIQELVRAANSCFRRDGSET